MLYSVSDIALIYGTSVTTTHLHIKKLKEGKKFKKHSIGAKYNEKDIARLSELLGFNWPMPEDKLKMLLNPKFQTK